MAASPADACSHSVRLLQARGVAGHEIAHFGLRCESDHGDGHVANVLGLHRRRHHEMVEQSDHVAVAGLLSRLWKMPEGHEMLLSPAGEPVAWR